MAINNTFLSAVSTQLNNEIVLEMLSSRPNVGEVFTPLRPPGQLCGYYDGINGRVDLYMVNAAGNRFLRAG